MNIPPYFTKKQLLHELNSLFNNSVTSVYFVLDPADNQLDFTFAKFSSTTERENCLNSYITKKKIRIYYVSLIQLLNKNLLNFSLFFSNDLWHDPLMFQCYTAFSKTNANENPNTAETFK